MMTMIRSERRGVKRAMLAWAGVGVMCMAAMGCSDALPSGVKDPATFQNEGGALKLYRGVRSEFEMELVSFIQTSGLLSDELVDRNIGSNTNVASGAGGVDIRIMHEGTFTNDNYSVLQRVRGDASQTIGMLKKYAPAQSPALRSEMYALAGYAEIMLADLYCSGVPLSTVDFEKDFTYKPGSSTVDIYLHAAALFDTAVTLGSDSARILNLARVGRGRALLGAGRLADAATAVAEVPDGFVYEFPVVWGTTQPGSATFTQGSVADSEGHNGIPYISSGDPRTRADSAGRNNAGRQLFFPAKYGDALSTTPLVVADWIEARLIRAEAALEAGDASWLTTLDALRTSIGLGALQDPGTDSARVTLLFRERAAWLFITGHRQGDMRRLIRQYGRPSSRVYPTGLYPGGAGIYGSDVNIPIPADETQNPLFAGCFDRNA